MQSRDARAPDHEIRVRPPGPHNAGFAPDRELTIRTGVSALTLSVLELLGPGGTRG